MTFRCQVVRACFGWWSGLSGCGHVTWREAGRRGRPFLIALTGIPEGELWASFPEASREEVLRVLSMLLERLPASAGTAAEGVGGERGPAA